MIYDLNEHEYVQMRMSRCMQRKEIFALFPAAFQAVAKGQLSKLSGTELAILISIMSVTIASGRIARDLSIRELADGIRDEEKNYITGGTGLSENGIRSALKSMSNAGLLRVYREAKSDGHDNSPRVYEIDFNQLDTGLARKIDALPPAKFEGGPLTVCRGLHISNYVTHTEKKATSSFILPGSEVARETTLEKIEMPYVGKKPRPEFATAAEAIASVMGKSRAATAARTTQAAAKAAHEISREEMQAIFDTVRTECSLPYRLMVTQREYGFLKKRLQANPPQDLTAFIRYCITYWATIAMQNRKASVNADTGRTVIKKALPEAPHFSTFTYWYPYFLKVYQNHLAGKVVAKTMDEHAKTLQKIERQATVALTTIRRKFVPAPPAPRPLPKAVVMGRAARGVSLEVPEFPEWDAKKN